MFYNSFNFVKASENTIYILNTYYKILEKLLEKQTACPKSMLIFNPVKIINALTKITTDLYSDPIQYVGLQADYIENSIKLINHYIAKFHGQQSEPLYEPGARDKRFQDQKWSEYTYFDFLKQMYLMNSQWILRVIKNAKNVDDRTKKQAAFFLNQFLNAISPSNFVYTNPTVLDETISTNGENIVNGLSNLLKDIEKSSSLLDISRVDDHHFKVGKNLANTPGEVIYKNDLMELICYNTSSDKSYSIPLLITPPCINKFYILDLRPENSFIKWLVDNGVTVFLISWKNVSAEYKKTSFEDYVSQGILRAIEIIQDNYKVPQVNLLGYCIGGTLTASALAYLAHHKKADVIKSASFLTTLLDHKDAGEISLFIDEEQLHAIQQYTEVTGYYGGDAMNMMFSVLRANDMIWNFVVNNYLLGKQPLNFDILYWNGDNTRLPAAMHLFYLRNMYLENNLIKPNKLKILNTPIDLGKISTPCYFIATHDDHIVPWECSYNGLQYLKCPVKFILGGSGHVAGIVNPPQSNKYSYWTNDNIAPDPKTWIDNAKEHKGSWWTEWLAHLQENSGKKTDNSAVKDISKKLSIGKAPGKYVLEK